MAAETLRLAVRVTPKGGRDSVEGWALDPGGRAYLKVRVSTAAADGAANAAVLALLAKALKTARSNLRIASGETARMKMIEIVGATGADVAGAFGAPPCP